MNSIDSSYLDLCQFVLENGFETEDRTGTGTISYPGTQTRYSLENGFPILTTKKVYWNGVVQELLWFLRGETNIRSLNENNVHIWDEWANPHGELGPVYGSQWRNFNGQGFDQIKNVINEIKTNPNSRRLIVTAWNPAQIDQMALPPCHMSFQFMVKNNKLYCSLYQRSCDLFLGAPFNISSYALLTHMVAQVCNLQVGELIHTIGDAHIYNNHLKQIAIQMRRTSFDLPKLELNPDIKDIDSFTTNDIKLINYKSHGVIKGKISV